MRAKSFFEAPEKKDSDNFYPPVRKLKIFMYICRKSIENMTPSDLKNPQILLLIGAPGSGKSTFAKYFIRTEENWMRLCRDDFRMMNFSNSLLSQRKESLISEILDISTETLLRKKCNVLLDATHCRAEYLKHYIEKFNSMADISFKLFECETDELIARCEKRYMETGRYVPENVIRRFVNDLETLKKTFDFSPRPLIQTTHIAEKRGYLKSEQMTQATQIFADNK
jgi:predicted kinase